MDVGELLSYKPPITPKRPVHTISEREHERVRVEEIPDIPIKKHKRIYMGPELPEFPLMEARREEKFLDPKPKKAAATVKLKKTKEKVTPKKIKIDESIQRLLENDTPKEADIYSEITLKRMILLFEKRTLKNREMRIKFVEHPEKFMESEIELHEVLQELHILATMPELYPLLIQLNAVPSLLELLSHENTDISVAVLNLLQELTDLDTSAESNTGIQILIDDLIRHDVFSLLVQNLDRLNEFVKEESSGVHDTLAIFENIIEYKNDMIEEVAKNGLLNWLLKRIRMRKKCDSNKSYTSEILVILLHNSEENRKLLGELNGVDVLLQQVAYYKRFDPFNEEENEFMENLFDSICSCLLDEKNRQRFLEGEGLQLMNLMLKEKKYSRNGSLKVLDHAMSGPFGDENCNKFVDILGLRTLFPLFMKTPKKSKKRTICIEDHEEHVLSVISSLFRHCQMPQRQRLISKFVENDMEKVDRLMELHFKYLDKMDSVDMEAEKLKATQKDILSEKLLEEEAYITRLDGGLYTLQLIDYIILEICTSGPHSVKERVVQILSLRGGNLNTIRQIMREHAGMMGTADGRGWQLEQHYNILNLIDKF